MHYAFDREHTNTQTKSKTEKLQTEKWKCTSNLIHSTANSHKYFLTFHRNRLTQVKRSGNGNGAFCIQISLNNSRKNLISHYEQMFHVFPLPYRIEAWRMLFIVRKKKFIADNPCWAAAVTASSYVRSAWLSWDWDDGNGRSEWKLIKQWESFAIHHYRHECETTENLSATYFIKFEKKRKWIGGGCVSESVRLKFFHFFSLAKLFLMNGLDEEDEWKEWQANIEPRRKKLIWWEYERESGVGVWGNERENQWEI